MIRLRRLFLVCLFCALAVSTNTFADIPKPTAMAAVQLTGDFGFPQAMQSIIDGKAVSKREWDNPHIYVALIKGYLMIHKADGTESALIVRDGDLFGKDWFVVQKPFRAEH